jgi:hypothetical protein
MFSFRSAIPGSLVLGLLAPFALCLSDAPQASAVLHFPPAPRMEAAFCAGVLLIFTDRF